LPLEIEFAGIEAEFINTLPPNVGRVMTGFIEQMSRGLIVSELTCFRRALNKNAGVDSAKGLDKLGRHLET